MEADGGVLVRGLGSVGAESIFSLPFDVKVLEFPHSSFRMAVAAEGRRDPSAVRRKAALPLQFRLLGGEARVRRATFYSVSCSGIPDDDVLAYARAWAVR